MRSGVWDKGGSRKIIFSALGEFDPSTWYPEGPRTNFGVIHSMMLNDICWLGKSNALCSKNFAMSDLRDLR